MMKGADKFAWHTYDTLLPLDFVSFSQRCLRELSPRSQFAMSWHIEIIAAIPGTVRKGPAVRVDGSARRQDPPTDHQPAAALSEVAVGLGRFSGLVSRARPGCADPCASYAGARR